jgi:hypothetical protein
MTNESATEWATRLSPEITMTYGVNEVHAGWFAPIGWNRKRTAAVVMTIPECEIFLTVIRTDDEPYSAILSRPIANLDATAWIVTACELAVENRAIIIFICDTPAQAGLAAWEAARLLPGYQRFALERLYETTIAAIFLTGVFDVDPTNQYSANDFSN